MLKLIGHLSLHLYTPVSMQKELFKYSNVNNMVMSIVLFNILIFSDESSVKNIIQYNIYTRGLNTV